MKRKLLFFAVIIIAVPLLSCASKMSDAEARSILADLIPRSQQLNAIFWGSAAVPEGIEPMSTVTTAQYYPVAEGFPYKTVDELKAAAGQVFSAEYLAPIYTVMFDGVDQYTPPRFKDGNGGELTVDICFDSYEFSTEIYPETAVVTEKGSGLVVAEVDCSVGGRPDKMNVTLRLQDGIWLLDSPTY